MCRIIILAWNSSILIIMLRAFDNMFAFDNILWNRRNVRKGTFGIVRPAKIQIRLRYRIVWSESSLGAFLIAKDQKSLNADKEGCDQTDKMRRLIWVFVGRTCQTVRFRTLWLKHLSMMLKWVVSEKSTLGQTHELFRPKAVWAAGRVCFHTENVRILFAQTAHCLIMPNISRVCAI